MQNLSVVSKPEPEVESESPKLFVPVVKEHTIVINTRPQTPTVPVINYPLTK